MELLNKGADKYIKMINNPKKRKKTKKNKNMKYIKNKIFSEDEKFDLTKEEIETFYSIDYENLNKLRELEENENESSKVKKYFENEICNTENGLLGRRPNDNNDSNKKTIKSTKEEEKETEKNIEMTINKYKSNMDNNKQISNNVNEIKQNNKKKLDPNNLFSSVNPLENICIIDEPKNKEIKKKEKDENILKEEQIVS